MTPSILPVVVKWLKDNKVNLLEWPSERPQSHRKCMGRTEKVCASKEAYNPDSVTLALSGRMSQNSPNLLWEVCGRLPVMFDPSKTI
jgi:hypothetical protein